MKIQGEYVWEEVRDGQLKDVCENIVELDMRESVHTRTDIIELVPILGGPNPKKCLMITGNQKTWSTHNQHKG